MAGELDAGAGSPRLSSAHADVRKSVAYHAAARDHVRVDLRDLRTRFRDDDQRHRAGMVVHLHLADDREQDECRYLLKFQWQLSMSYTEVTVDELRAHVRPEKLAVVEALIDALHRSPDDVERWIQETVRALPEIEDRGFQRWNDLA